MAVVPRKRAGRIVCVQQFMSDFPALCDWSGGSLAELGVRHVR